MDCILVAGIFFLAGTDWNGDRYVLNIDMINHITQAMSISDTDNDDPRNRTMITTTNGLIVEDAAILHVISAISTCERYYMDEYAE